MPKPFDLYFALCRMSDKPFVGPSQATLAWFLQNSCVHN
jgi:hypothetical protein